MSYGTTLKKKRPMVIGVGAPKGKTSGITRQNNLTQHMGNAGQRGRTVPPPDKGPARSGITRQDNLHQLGGHNGVLTTAPNPDPGPGAASGLDADDSLQYLANNSQRGTTPSRGASKMGSDQVATAPNPGPNSMGVGKWTETVDASQTYNKPFKKKGGGGGKNRRFRRR